MPSKLQMYEQMADRTAKQVTGSFGNGRRSWKQWGDCTNIRSMSSL